MTMKLWLVQRPDTWDYDVLNGALVRAESEHEARTLVSDEHGDEGKDVWFKESTRCIPVETVETKGNPEVLLKDFTAG